MNVMVDPALKEQLLTDLELLPPHQQKHAVDYVHSLRLTRANDGAEPDASYANYVRSEIAAGLEDLEQGRTYTQEEIEALYPEP